MVRSGIAGGRPYGIGGKGAFKVTMPKKPKAKNLRPATPEEIEAVKKAAGWDEDENMD